VILPHKKKTIHFEGRKGEQNKEKKWKEKDMRGKDDTN